jgi:hypothetical protein
MSPERRARLLADLAERKARNEAGQIPLAGAPPRTTVGNADGESARDALQHSSGQDEILHGPMRSDPSAASEPFDTPRELSAAYQTDEL